MTHTRQLTKEQKFEKEKLREEKIACFWYDIAKLSFGGLVVGGLMALFVGKVINLYSLYILVIGVLSTFLFARLGYTAIKE
jgi:hypothetical protein